MEDTTTKRVSITGGAANGLTPEGFEGAMEGGRKGGKSRKNPKKVFQVTREGGGTSPGTLVQLASTSVPGTVQSIAVGNPSVLTASGAPVGLVAPSIGGAEEPKKTPKIILSKTKKKGKVLLAAPKPVAKVTDVPTVRRKTIKKVNMSLKGLTRKMKKANKIRRSATDKTIGDIKGELVKMELVKADTKAPEAVLRQIYLDVETMKKRAL